MFGLESLGDVGVGAGLQSPEHVGLVFPAGEHDDGHPGGHGILLQETADLVALDLGHLDVQDHEVGEKGEGLHGRLDSVPGHVHPVTGLLQYGPGDLDHQLVVVRQEQVFPVFHKAPSPFRP
jgi:hypothetical protein